jgi:hypothetical protein
MTVITINRNRSPNWSCQVLYLHEDLCYLGQVFVLVKLHMNTDRDISVAATWQVGGDQFCFTCLISQDQAAWASLCTVEDRNLAKDRQKLSKNDLIVTLPHIPMPPARHRAT